MKRTLALAAAVLTAVSLIRPVSALPPPVYESDIQISEREIPALFHQTNITSLTFTDIAVSINGASIRAYGTEYVFVYAEDLASYGFDVTWDPEADSLTIRRNPDKEISADYPQEPIPEGRTIYDRINWYTPPIRYSTIVTCITDGVSRTPIACLNHSGRMLVRLDQIAEYFGREYVWNPEARTLSLTLADRTVKPIRNMWYEAKEIRHLWRNYDLFVCFTVDPEEEPQLYEALLSCTVEMDGETLIRLPTEREPRKRQARLTELYAKTDEVLQIHSFLPSPVSQKILLYAETSDYDDTVIFRAHLHSSYVPTSLPLLIPVIKEFR